MIHRVTIGICVRNSARTLKNTIESIVAQKYPHQRMQVVFVDGESTDRTLQIARKLFTKTDIPVEFHSDRGAGLGYARQMVVDLASGKYVIFVDGDVELPGDFLQEQVDFMEEFPCVGVAVGRYMRGKGTLVAELQNLYSNVTEFVGSDATIYRVDALRQVDGFDRNIRGAFEDLDVMIRLQLRGWAVRTNPRASFYHIPRQTLVELWAEQKWSGYGGHYFSHKHNFVPCVCEAGSHPFRLLQRFPVMVFLGTTRVALRTYRSARQKKVFLLPLLFSFRSIPWWLGFIEGHVDSYGHQEGS